MKDGFHHNFYTIYCIKYLYYTLYVVVMLMPHSFLHSNKSHTRSIHRRFFFITSQKNSKSSEVHCLQLAQLHTTKLLFFIYFLQSMKARFYTKIFICFISITFQLCGSLLLSVIPHHPSFNKGQSQHALSEHVFLITFTAFTNSSILTIFCCYSFNMQ